MKVILVEIGTFNIFLSFCEPLHSGYHSFKKRSRASSAEDSSALASDTKTDRESFLRRICFLPSVKLTCAAPCSRLWRGSGPTGFDTTFFQSFLVVCKYLCVYINFLVVVEDLPFVYERVRMDQRRSRSSFKCEPIYYLHLGKTEYGNDR